MDAAEHVIVYNLPPTKELENGIVELLAVGNPRLMADLHNDFVHEGGSKLLIRSSLIQLSVVCSCV